MPAPDRLPVVGIGADGWDGVPGPLRELVLGADVLLGGRRHLDLVPPVPGQERCPWPSPLRDGLPPLLDQYASARVVALASGDPLVSGVGATLIDLMGPDRVAVHPAVSSVALARARTGWPAETCRTVTLVGRDEHRVLRHCQPRARLLVLSSDEHTPAALARLLAGTGWGAATLTVLGDLGATTESRTAATAQEWQDGTPDLPRLHVLAVELPDRPAAPAESAAGATGPATAVTPPAPRASWGAAGLPDEAYEHDGQLTKRDLRASALARLAPAPGQVLWDVGAGSGAVAVEWLRSAESARAVAVERDPARAARIARNAARLGVPELEVVTGEAPAVLDDLPTPDAVFVGGGATTPGLLETCREALAPGGRLVVHGVTLETETALADAYATHGGQLTRLTVETAAPVGSFTGWTPARAVTQWTWEAP